MFKFVLQKIFSKKWMIISLIIGNILLVGLVASNPIYSQAILQKTLNDTMANYMLEENEYPSNVTFNAEISKKIDKPYTSLEQLQGAVKDVENQFGLPTLYLVEDVKIRSKYIDLENGNDETAVLSIGYLNDIENHSEIVYGENYSTSLESDGSIGVIVSEYMLSTKDLIVGERYNINNIQDVNGNGLALTIKGVFENTNPNDTYWVNAPSSYNNHVFMDKSLFNKLFVDGDDISENLVVSYTLQTDYTKIDTTNVEAMQSVIQKYQNEWEENSKFSIKAEFTDIFNEHINQKSELSLILWVLQVPIYILLAAFIYMVSSRILELEQSEISIFKSRGASKKQIINIYLLQSTIISVVSLVLGIPLGYFICNVLGSSNAFLEFVNRSSLPATIGLNCIIYALIATAFSIVTMVLPVFKHSNIGIVTAKRKKQQKFKLKLWEKTGIDFICILVSLYGLYSTNLQKEFIEQKALMGESLDPFIFLYSSIFIIGAGLLSIRIFPWLVKLIFVIGKKAWSPSSYLSFKRIIGGNDKQGFIMIFLIMTISIGTFNSVTARTINSNEENSIRYNNGADIVLKQSWTSGEGADDEISSSSSDITEPNYALFSQMEGVESYTKVYVNEDIDIKQDGTVISNVKLMAIDTKGFGQTAWFKDGLLKTHWYNYLNAISKSPEGILISSNAKEKLKLEVGDSINYYYEPVQGYVRGTIYGFVDYFPSYKPTTKLVDEDGKIVEQNNYLIVSNLSQVQASLGVLPYEVWINVQDSTTPVYDFINDNKLKITSFTDTNADIIAQKNDPIFQGTNGIFTVGFITVLILCTVGFLIYWILSIISRQLQFGIYRAMGMSMKEILMLLGNEQLYVSGYSIIVGAVVGYLASKLYVPLALITYANPTQAIPLNLIFNTSDSVKIFLVIGFMITLCMVVLSVMISKLKVTQVLKLGED